MNNLKLFSYPGNPKAQKILIAAKYNNISIETPEFDVVKSRQSLQSNIFHPKVPFLETANGNVYETGSILRYIARLRPSTELLGSSLHNQALVDQWIDFSGSEIDNIVQAWIYPVLYEKFPYNAETTATSRGIFSHSLEILDDYLKSHTFLAGENITLADISVAGSLLLPVQTVVDSEFREPFPNVWRWFLTCVNQPQWKDVLGNVVMVDVTYSPKHDE
eukprot:c4384_g1_i1.p1 GENE.c4384_g1_i1~~c4384_g1_i1.p1  ORF type:complete len:219 (-),score=93.35 c4384_g1_i1:11-667(-)